MLKISASHTFVLSQTNLEPKPIKGHSFYVGRWTIRLIGQLIVEANKVLSD